EQLLLILPVMKQQTGFTIIELMITVAVGGILLAVAMPSFNNLVKNNCMTTNSNSFVSSVQYTRNQAVRLRQPVNMTGSNAADADNEWGTGWVVWQDADNDGSMDAGEELRVSQLGCELTTIDETGDIDTITYRPTGFLDIALAGATFDICDDRTGETGRQITISATGRPSIENEYNGCP
ncbi:MAG: GspH/FimT family pseudopilin, partial [Pseudohongiellaceae bacterium]